MVLSVRRSVEEPARQLARLSRDRQERFLEAVEYVSRQTQELAFNICMFGVDGLERMDAALWPRWIDHLLDVYDENGVLKAITTMRRVEDFVQAHHRGHTGVVTLEQVSGVLGRFVTGLSGRDLKLARAADTYTDTELLFLPERADRFPRREDNFRLYKATAVHLWAQTWFGTWRLPFAERLAGFADPGRALQWFHALETVRLDACLRRDLPGLWRDMAALAESCGAGVPGAELPESLRRPLQAAGADVATTWRLLDDVALADPVPVARCYQGALFPERTEAVAARRHRDERGALQGMLAQLLEGLRREGRLADDAPEIRLQEDSDGGQTRFTVLVQGEAVSPPEEVQRTLASIRQDFGRVPPEWLAPAGSAPYDVPGGTRAEGDVPPPATPGALLYDEWDHVRGHYRRDWCQLRVRDVHPRDDGFVADTLRRHRGLLKHLYRTFEALRGEDRRLKRCPQGDGLDIDAVVESFGDRSAGIEPQQHWFTERRRVERDVAAAFLVDMSGSTKGWINEVEREALVLLCESLEILGDRYAVFGFSGFTHKRCELLRVKRFDEPYGDEVRARISGIRPQDYTRLGVFIRHLTRELAQVEARTRLLITLSDGRPDDQDGYRGEYGIEDTRRALLEARHQGIHPYCITIDDEALEYLPHMYGYANFTRIDDVRRLPYRVADIYRRLTIR